MSQRKNPIQERREFRKNAPAVVTEDVVPHPHPHKDTATWCKGKVGRAHQWENVPATLTAVDGHQVEQPGLQVRRCPTCGKVGDYVTGAHTQSAHTRSASM